MQIGGSMKVWDQGAGVGILECFGLRAGIFAISSSAGNIIRSSWISRCQRERAFDQYHAQ